MSLFVMRGLIYPLLYLLVMLLCMYGVNSSTFVGGYMYFCSREGQGKVELRSNWFKVVEGGVRFGGIWCEVGVGKVGTRDIFCNGRTGDKLGFRNRLGFRYRSKVGWSRVGLRGRSGIRRFGIALTLTAHYLIVVMTGIQEYYAFKYKADNAKYNGKHTWIYFLMLYITFLQWYKFVVILIEEFSSEKCH